MVRDPRVESPCERPVGGGRLSGAFYLGKAEDEDLLEDTLVHGGIHFLVLGFLKKARRLRRRRCLHG
jgi:hypothetical protein